MPWFLPSALWQVLHSICLYGEVYAPLSVSISSLIGITHDLQTIPSVSFSEKKN